MRLKPQPLWLAALHSIGLGEIIRLPMKLPSFSFPLTGAVLCAFTLPFFADALLPKQAGGKSEKDIYHGGWIDFNKNGKKDVFEYPTQLRDKPDGTCAPASPRKGA